MGIIHNIYKMSFILHFLLISLISAQFNIPLPFGNLLFGKNEKGELEIGGNQNFNLFGWGGKRDFKLTTGNGTFKIDKTDEALLNGSVYGGSGSLGVDEKKGIDIGQNLTLDNQTLEASPGKEANFLEGLLNLFKPTTTPHPLSRK